MTFIKPTRWLVFGGALAGLLLGGAKLWQDRIFPAQLAAPVQPDGMTAPSSNSGMETEDRPGSLHGGRHEIEAPPPAMHEPPWVRRARRRVSGQLPPIDGSKAIPGLNCLPTTNLSLDPDAELVTASEPFVERLNELLDEDDVSAAIQEARTLMTHSNRMVRWSVVEALWWIGEPALGPMAKMMDDPDEEIREMAIDSFFESISSLEESNQAAEVLAIAALCADPAIRLKVQEELANLPASQAFESLAAMLDDSDEEVREQAKINLSFVSERDFASMQEAMAWFDQHADKLEASERDDP